MADKTTSGLASAVDPNKFPVYGTTEEEQQNYIKSNQDILKSLEDRYAQPNWFKVAAGFAKPQLGGFLASLGSASEAMGENLEQQRAMAVPIAEMRARLGVMQSQFGQNVKVSKEIADWRAHNEGKLPPADKIADWAGKAPDSPAVQSLLAQQKTGVEQQAQSLQILKGQYDSGAISKDQYAAELARLKGTTSLAPTPDVDPQRTQRIQADIAGLQREIAATPKNEVGRLQILNSELARAQGQLNQPQSAQPPQTLESAGLPGAEAQAQAAANVKELEKNDADRIKAINNNRRDITDPRRNYLSRGLSLVDDPKVQDAMGQLFKSEGFVSGMQNALEKGVNFALAHPTAAFSANIAFPIDTYLQSVNADPQTKQKLRELTRIVMQDSLEDIRTGSAALGGGHMSTTEFQNVMGMFPTTSEPYKLMRQYMASRAAQNELNADLHKIWNSYSSSGDYARKPLKNFFQLEDVTKAYDTYDKRHRNALKLAD